MYKKRNNCQGIEKHLYTPSLEFCTHCSYWLCPTCINEEKKDAIRYNNEIVVPFCRIHRRSYRYYCYNCSCNICEECAMNHTNHSYQALAVMVTENELVEMNKVPEVDFAYAHEHWKKRREESLEYLKNALMND